MDIVHIVLGKANPERMNGVNKVVFNLATKQKEHGENVVVWGITHDEETNYPARNFETVLFIKKFNPFQIPNRLKKEILAKSENTVYHFHGGWIPIFYSLSKFLNKTRRKYVITPHGAYNSVAMNKNKLIKKIYFFLFEKKLLHTAKKVHCIGKTELESLQKIDPKAKGVLVPYGFESSKRSIKITDNKNIIFGFIGRLDLHTKGLDLMLDGFEIFTKGNPDAQLWIIGDGEDRKSLEDMIKTKNLVDKITVFGSLFGDNKNNLLEQLDFFLHPSRNEGLPVAVIEAADFGKPCIVSEFTNIGELIVKHKAGLMFSEYNANHLSNAMAEAFNIWKNKEMFHQTCLNAKRMVEIEFNWVKILKQLNTELYGNTS